MSKIIIIGSGFGGLGLAVRLQAKGFHVTVLEKNKQVGGHASQLVRSGYTFDMGPSLVTAPEIIGGVFKAAGRRMEEYLDLIKLEPFYRIYFHDKSYLDYTGDTEKMKSQMATFSQRDAKNYDRFMKACHRIYDAVITDGLGSTPFMNWGSLFHFLPRALKLGAIQSTYSFVRRYFEHPHHRFTFSFHPLFIGGNPFRTPSVYLMIPYLEKAGGVWFSSGGMYSLVRAYEKIFTELGGTIHTNQEVREIRIENGKASGVSTVDHYYPADAVVSNADIAHTYKNLVGMKHRRKWTDHKIDRLSFSMSAFLIYLGVRRQYPQLLHHTLILSHRYRELVTDIFDRRILPEDFSMYLHAPSRTDATMAPAGCESMYVLIPVTSLAASIDWDKMKKSYADRVLRFLEDDFGLTDLKNNIEVLEIFTPADFHQQRNSYLGTPWGIEPKLTQTAYFRPHNQSEDIPNLYFTGAGTHPGAGLPGVLLSAETTEKLIIQNHSSSKTE
jgi:phytoene desaturase